MLPHLIFHKNTHHLGIFNHNNYDDNLVFFCFLLKKKKRENL
jgi:hypothetical protein